ncbi:uncharacterized protein LOC121969765 isoform X1 [Zingiber officinale]|uniref:uncharacterized protein LOC121969765 isoform X1 n=1 Tax=Zingiber officinale TaxID=94328 RepID=UPI001C4C40F0|nr:uncharacterized protein LOC121969765 isoform X1 [Zingiber officinale]
MLVEEAVAATSSPRLVKNMLYNLTIEIEIPGIQKFKLKAILDTEATTCCVDQRSVPKEALERNTFVVSFSRIDSQQTANMKLKNGRMIIGDNTFHVPYTYSFPMVLGDNIQFIIGCNFIRAMQGGLRIEGNTVTFYKNLTTINTLSSVHAAIEELEMDEDEYIQIKEMVHFLVGRISPTKMKIAVKEIEFLGAIIGNCKIKLQSHVISKIADFNNNDLKTTKGMRSWLGLLNYARNYIPNLGKLLSPLYAKTSPNGEKRLNQQDWDLIHQVKEKVKQPLELEIPPECYVILEVDGCMDGWGGICKWKKQKFDPISSEKICAYSSGKFNLPKSTIDAEIYAVMNTMEDLKIYFLDKQELLIRTDCQAIISFFGKTLNHKPSRVRWLAFTDYITGAGPIVQFEHIDIKNNQVTDSLSRLIFVLILTEWPEQDLNKLAMVAPAIKELQAQPNLKTQETLSKALWSLSTSLNNTNRQLTSDMVGPSLSMNSIKSQKNYTNSKQQCEPLMQFNNSNSSIH